MSVILETSLGDLVIDLNVESAPKVCDKSVAFYDPRFPETAVADQDLVS